MTSASLRTKGGIGLTPVVSGDRWGGPGRVGGFSLGMGIVLLGSLLFHVAVVATALVQDSPAEVAPVQEIPVEIVEEKPADPPKVVAKDVKTESKAAEAPKANETAAKPEPAPPVALKPALAEEAKPTPPAPTPAETKIAAMEKEFASLKAEREALEARRAEDEAAEAKDVAAKDMATKDVAAARPLAPAAPGLGPLPASFQAVALPAVGDGAGEAVDYRELVFSELAKAKGLGETEGLPGTAGVHFSIDETGRIASLEIAVPSGVPALDAQALAIVRKAAPFPAPPQGAQRSFDANVSFVAQPRR